MRKHMAVLALCLFAFFGCKGEADERIRFKPLSEDEKLVYEIRRKEGGRPTDRILTFYAAKNGKDGEKRLLAAWEFPFNPPQFVLRNKGAFFNIVDPKLEYSTKEAIYFIDGTKGEANKYGEIAALYCSSENGQYLVCEDYDYGKENPYEHRILLINFPKMNELTSFVYRHDASHGLLSVYYKRVDDGNTIIAYIGELDTVVTRLEVNTKEQRITEIGP